MIVKVFERSLARPSYLLLLTTICSVIFAITSFWYVQQRAAFPTGDEPHYLVISQTLLKYHSLAVMQDYAHGDYLIFYPGPIEPHVMYNLKGQILPIHNIGGPVLWLIPFALWGRLGAVLFISFITVLIIVNIYLFLTEMDIGQVCAFVISLAFAIASPFSIYSHLTFIEPIAALCCLYVFRKALRGILHTAALVISGCCLGLLPWLHVRFALLEMILFLALLYRLYQKNGTSHLKPYVYYFTPVALLFIAFEAYSYFVWGTFNPAANQVTMLNQPFESNPLTGLLGLLLDQEYGLLFSFPLFFLLFSGILLTLKKKKLAVYHLLTLLMTLAYLPLIVTLQDWHGGFAPPVRFILVLLPLYAFYLAYATEHMNRLAASIILVILITAGMVVNLATPDSSFNRTIEKNPLLAHILLFKRPLTDYVPLMSAPGQQTLLLAWLCFYVAISLLLWWMIRHTINKRKLFSKPGLEA